MSPVVTAVDAEGRVMISTREPAMKTRNLRRDGQAALCVLNDGFFGEWIQVSGDTEVIALPEAMDLLVDTYRQIAGEHDDWDDYRAAMVRDRRVILRITIAAAGPDRRG
jgi:PPOX class probable F420-dependent enzyme